MVRHSLARRDFVSLFDCGEAVPLVGDDATVRSFASVFVDAPATRNVGVGSGFGVGFG